MKLISCHIINFGKLSAFDYSFGDKISIIVEKNGWGKTTFAEFIKSMFYSLPQTRTKNIDENLRKKYKPWNNGVFGGSLIFEANNNTYKIERTFGDNENEDTFLLINTKTNKPSSDYSKKIGEELFGLDSESFAKTIYIAETNISTQITDKISAKLNDLVQEKEDVSNYDMAINIINEKLKIYKKTGERGLYYDTKRQINEINMKKQSMENIKNTINNLELIIQENKNKLTMLKDKEKQISDQIEQNAKYEVIKNKLGTLQALKEETAKLENSLKDIKNGWNNIVPTKEELINMQKNAQNLTVFSKEISNLKNDAKNLSNKLCELVKFFNNAEVNHDIYQKINKDYNKLQELQTQLLATPIKAEKQSNKNTKKITSSLMLIVFSVLFAASIVLGITAHVQAWIWVCLSVSFAVCAGISAFVLLALNKTAKTSTSRDQSIYNDSNLCLSEIENKLKPFFINDQKSLHEKISIFNNNYSEYSRLSDLINAKEKEIADKTTEETKLFSSLNQFLQTHNIALDEDPSVVILKQMQILANYENQLSNYNANIQKIKTMENDSETLPDNYIPSKQLSLDKEKTQNEIANLEKTIFSDNNSYESYCIKYEELLELESNEESLKNKLSQVSHKIKILEETKKYLSLAKDELDSNFLKPIASEFKKLATSVQLENNNKFNIDTNFDISIEDNGQTKDFAFASTGYKDLAYICARLAIINVMYKKEKPFIVLDDPFINLDEEKFELVKKVIGSWSKDYQFIYFACHKSRI